MKKDALDKLTSLMERLRGPKGCPWDREQTLESLTPFIIEEAYEVVGAIESGKASDIMEELGDLLFQIIFAAQIANEKRKFDITDVMEASVEKMTRRHPHVFGKVRAETPADVLKHWARIKKEEKEKGGKKEGCLSGIPDAFPSLLRAHKITEKASRAGFDWKNLKGVLGKVNEELSEFMEALSTGDAKRTEEEFGDLLFSLVNLSRFIEVNPEEALRKTIGRFISRFHYIEKTLDKKKRPLQSASLEEMERLWQEAKAKEKKRTITES
ncbi:MAG: nucleoside triphosphate pyrophosphohydrolase [Deltaproteobacteria bacterium]|nr:nucleoside triphosphate pyrophosphohydrolase [Deltaproteobacteria bacterium]